MGKRCFVRVNVGGKLHKLSRSDITRTHFIKKKRLPAIPCFTLTPNIGTSCLELANTASFEACLKREESSEDGCSSELGAEGEVGY